MGDDAEKAEDGQRHIGATYAAMAEMREENQHLREMVEAMADLLGAVEAEREACARVAEMVGSNSPDAAIIASEIRKRSRKLNRLLDTGRQQRSP